MSVSGSNSVSINASPEAVMALIEDVASMPQWFPGCLEAEVLESDDSGRPLRARQVNDVKVAKDEFEVTYTYTDNSMSWTLVAPSKAQKLNDGSWTIVPDGNGCKATLDLTIDAALPLPGFMQKKVVGDTVKSATKALKSHAESA
jgi:ribosome-associated toxin RatA of RatAB toxin-antitoxin module